MREMGSCGLYRAIKGLTRVNKKEISPKETNHNNYNNNNFRKSITRNVLTQEAAAVRIHTAFRRYRVEMEGGYSPAVSALRQISLWSRMQAEIRARRVGMIVECQTRQKRLDNEMKLKAKHRELEVEWSSNTKSMREVVNRIQQREEAAARRERAMAYALTHQWRPHAKQYIGKPYFDLSKESWGWSWKDCWATAHSWLVRSQGSPTVVKSANTNHRRSVSTSIALGKASQTQATKLPRGSWKSTI